MNSLLTVLNKTLVREFYRQNAGLFVIVLLFAGGFLRGQEHKALAAYAVHDKLVLGLYMLVWLLYTLFVVNFGIRTLREHPFLLLLRLVSGPRRFAALMSTSAQLLMPVLAYAAFVAMVGWEEKAVLSLVLVAVVSLLLIFIPVAFLDLFLRNSTFKISISFPAKRKFTTPYLLFFLRHLIQKEPLSLLLSKAGSLLLFSGLCALYPTDDYDLRLLLLGSLFAAALHTNIAYAMYRFEAIYLLPVRNLPYSALRRLLQYILILTLLVSPELILLVRNQPAGVTTSATIWTWALLVTLVVGVFSLLFVKHRPPDRLMPVVFGMVILYFFPIMYRLPVYSLVLTTTGIGVVLFFRYYSRSQPAFSE